MEKHMKKEYPSVRKITDQERIGMVKEIFSTVTARYDFLNHFLSMRRDVAWRRFTARRMPFFETLRLLDIATGTADLAIAAARRHGAITVTGLDFVKEMLDVGQAKIARRDLTERIGLVQGDALSLPFPAESFDAATMAFGIRNIPDKMQALREMARVVIPGGRVMILEMCFTPNWFSSLMYRTYLNRILPRVAARFVAQPGRLRVSRRFDHEFPLPRCVPRPHGAGRHGRPEEIQAHLRRHLSLYRDEAKERVTWRPTG